MLAPIRSRGHLTVLPGGRTDVRSPKEQRAARRLNRLLRETNTDRVVTPVTPDRGA